jgi:hypothetical protein
MTNKTKNVSCRVTENQYRQLKSEGNNISNTLSKAIDIYLMYKKDPETAKIIELALKQKELKDLKSEELKVSTEIEKLRNEYNLPENINVRETLKETKILTQKSKLMKQHLNVLKSRKLEPKSLLNSNPITKRVIETFKGQVNEFNRNNYCNIEFDDYVSDLNEMYLENETGDTESKINDEIRIVEKIK